MLFNHESLSRKIFIVANYIFITLVSIACIFPMLHIVAISLSSKAAVDAGTVTIWPVGFSLSAYKFVAKGSAFYTAFYISVERAVLGIIINMIITILAAYPLSISRKKFKARGLYVWFFLITMLFGGGLIPGYLIIKYTGLLNTIWALLIPGAVPVFNVILLQNFFKELPEEISESAFIEGAGHWTVLTRILVPISKPVMATLVLFVAVGHWNSWFDGMLYMNSASKYPLQTYLQTIVVQSDLKTVTTLNDVMNVSEKNSKAAQIILAMLPILMVYPFLQKHFTKGIILGSLKG